MKRTVLIAGLAIAITIFLSSQVLAQGGKLRFGNTKIIPGLTIQEVYDDNIFLGNGSNNTTELEESDWITHLMPGVELNHDLWKRGVFSLGYTGDFAYYQDNDENDWQTHEFMFNLDYQAPGGILAGIDATYIDAEDPYSNLELYREGLLTERTNTDLKTKLGYDFGNRFKAFAFFNYDEQDYELERDYSQDYDDTEFGAGFQMRLMPKTWGFLRYYFGSRDYTTHPATTTVTESNDADFDWQRVNLGLTWDIGARLEGELNFGYQWSDFDNPTDPSGNEYDDKNLWIAETLVIYTASPATTVALSITRGLRQTGSDANEYFKNTGIGINVKHEIQKRFIVTLGGAFNENGYNVPAGAPRDDDIDNLWAKLDYRIQDWLTAGVGYAYRKKDSNYTEYGYTDNQYMISVRGVY